MRALLDDMRLTKDRSEQDTMRRAANISSAGHVQAMRHCRPEMAEYELEAELTHEFRRRGANGHAYTPIVAGGANACVLHYVDNNRLLPEHGLVLIDAGCELEGYAADITRTFPVNGRFSPAQRDTYEVVLAAQLAAIAAIRPGVSFMAYHDAAVRILAQGMIDLGLLKGSWMASSKMGITSASTCTAPATGWDWTYMTRANTRKTTRAANGSNWRRA